ncbi:kinase [Pedobacter panaciterrae]|uniref:kinase n=1 Tax=Pedobacter panaciterrae TaxID=363849 RepID=UPI0025989E9B|nr:kinase [uncultured Pedobacter sp.]
MRSLLYYDTISSIVPDDYFHGSQNHYEPFMFELVREHLVIPLNPIEQLTDPFSLVEPFMEFINSHYYNIEKRRYFFTKQIDGYILNNQKFSPSNINGLKFNHNLLYNLEQLGLARRTDGHWYHVENYTAGYLMSYLSNILATKLSLLPITDRPLNLPFKMNYNKPQHTNEARIRREKVLMGVMPYPMDIDLSKLMRLKERHNNELIALRTIVEQIALDSRYDNDELLNERIRELNYNKEQLSARFQENRLGKILFSNVFGLAGAVYGLSQIESKLGAVIGGSLVFANAVHSALQIEDPTKIYDPSGMKYLALADSRLKIK